MSEDVVNGLYLVIFYSFLWAAILIYLIQELVTRKADLDETRVRYEDTRRLADASIDALKAQTTAFQVAMASYQQAKNEHEGIRPN